MINIREILAANMAKEMSEIVDKHIINMMSGSYVQPVTTVRPEYRNEYESYCALYPEAVVVEKKEVNPQYDVDNGISDYRAIEA